MTETTVNIPLLRKAVEWAEAEAAKPWELCEWNQGWWVAEPDDLDALDALPKQTNAGKQKSPECGTCFCVAGFIAASTLADGEVARGEHVYLNGTVVADIDRRAAEQLGLGVLDASPLFFGRNTIEQVREIAEALAGERL